MTVARRQVSRAVWPLWVAASVTGNALGAVAFSGWGEKARGLPVAALLVLLLPAFLQWLILRPWFPHAGWWIPASGVGWLLGFLLLGWGITVADTQGETAFARIAVAAGFLLPGAVAGAVQWLVLRRWVAHAGWWVLATGISWGAGLWVFLSLASTGQGRYFEGGALSQALAGAASGAISGAITGLDLVLLLRSPNRSEPSSLSRWHGPNG